MGDIYQDKTLSNGIFFLELLTAVDPRVVNWDLVTNGENGMQFQNSGYISSCSKNNDYYCNADEEKKSNATYIISVARKLGCSIFLLPEDIMEVKLGLYSNNLIWVFL